LWPKKEERRVIFLPKFGGLKIKKKKQEYLLRHNIPFLFDFSQFGEISHQKKRKPVSLVSGRFKLNLAITHKQ